MENEIPRSKTNYFSEQSKTNPNDAISQITEDNTQEVFRITDENVFKNLEQIAPHLNWRNAAVVPWTECVRNPSAQPEPSTDVQKTYYENNQAFRLHFLSMISDIFTGRINNLESFRGRFSHLHRVLVTGESGENIYMTPDQKTKIGNKSAYDIAGNYRHNVDDWNEKLEDLLIRLQNFLRSENFSNHSPLELAEQVGEIFFENINFPELTLGVLA